MRIAFPFLAFRFLASWSFTALLTLILLFFTGPARAAEAHTILLGSRDRYELAETEQWRVEIQREVIGRFADVQVSPKSPKGGEAFLLALYFIADTPDLARLDTPAKIADSVLAGSERFLPIAVEKKVSLQALTPRNSFGSLAVLTEADPKTAPGGFKYQTRGMVRLSPDAALGFSLLSREINTASYRLLLSYVYSFIKLPPNVLAAPTVAPTQPPAPAPATPTAAVPAPIPTPSPAPVAMPKPIPKIEPAERPAPAPAVRAIPAPQPSRPAPRGAQRDMRECLNLPTDAEIMRCASGRK